MYCCWVLSSCAELVGSLVQREKDVKWKSNREKSCCVDLQQKRHAFNTSRCLTNAIMHITLSLPPFPIITRYPLLVCPLDYTVTTKSVMCPTLFSTHMHTYHIDHPFPGKTLVSIASFVMGTLC